MRSRQGVAAAPRGGPAQAATPYDGPRQPRPRPAISGEAHEAVAEFREAVRLKPDSARARNILRTCGRGLDEFAIEFREAIRLKPDYAEAHYSLGDVAARPSAARRGRSPNSARRSGSSPTTPTPTRPSARALRARGSSTRPSRHTARRSGSSPTRRSPLLSWRNPSGRRRQRGVARHVPKGTRAGQQTAGLALPIGTVGCRCRTAGGARPASRRHTQGGSLPER